MLTDNIWAHLEEAPVEKSLCFHSCSFYSEVNSSFIVTYMYWNSFTFQTHLDCFTWVFSMNFFLCVEFPSKSPGVSGHQSVRGCSSTYGLREMRHLTAVEPSICWVPRPLEIQEKRSILSGLHALSLIGHRCPLGSILPESFWGKCQLYIKIYNRSK